MPKKDPWAALDFVTARRARGYTRSKGEEELELAADMALTYNVLLRSSALNVLGNKPTKLLIARFLGNLASNTANLNAAAPLTPWSNVRARAAVAGRPT